MRLLQPAGHGDFSLTEDFTEHVPPYAILSHTWGKDPDEVTFDDFRAGTYRSKTGYRKIQFCGEQAARDGLQYFWVDSCCINKSNHAELSEAINSMFSWYRDAAKCYVYLSDVSTRSKADEPYPRSLWKSEFRRSRWFTRAWTLQELIAPHSVEFYSREGERLGDKKSLEPSLHEITEIPVEVFQGKPLVQFSITERMLWGAKRSAKRKEDEAYCLFGVFGLHMPIIYGEGRENAFIRLEEEIGKRSRGANMQGNIHWMVPGTVSSLFTGRSDLLSRIQKTLKNKSISAATKQKRFVITGLGGQGKSEICLQVASLMKQQFWGVFWIDVDKPSTAEKNFIAVAKLLGHLVESVSEALQVLATTHQSWLLILDNADDPEFDYQIYFPSGTHGAVLITSRVAECKIYSPDAFEALGGLEEQDSRELLLKAAGLSPELWLSHGDQAKDVVSLLGSHTLALIQAGAYISQGHCQLHQYPEVYRQQRTRLLKYRPKQAQSRYSDVYATFEASANVLEQSQSESAKDALHLLQILSMLDSSVLTLQVFEEAWTSCKAISQASSVQARHINDFVQDHISHLPRFMIPDDDAWDSFRLTQASSQLESLSLVIRHTMDSYQGWSMHPLTHAWAKDRQDLERQGMSWIAAGCVLGFSLSNRHTWPTQERLLLPHVLSYLDIKVNKAFELAANSVVTPILLNCGWALFNMRQDSRLGQLIQDTFFELGQNPRELSEEFLPLYDLQARSLMRLGRNEEAVALLDKVVKMREIMLAKTHPDLVESHHQLAIAYRGNGQFAEGITLLEQVVKIKATILVETHPAQLASQHELACAYKVNGQVAEAIALLEQVVKIKATILVETHPAQLASQHELACAYKVNGQVAEAIALLEQVVKIRRTILAETDPDRLASQHELAGAYRANGQIAEAIALLEHVVEIKETILLETHLERLASQHQLAIAYEANGQVAEAIALLEQVVTIGATLAETHPNRLASQHQLAVIYGSNGQIAEAIALLKHVVEIKATIFAETHPRRLVSEVALSYYLQKLNFR